MRLDGDGHPKRRGEEMRWEGHCASVVTRAALRWYPNDSAQGDGTGEKGRRPPTNERRDTRDEVEGDP